MKVLHRKPLMDAESWRTIQSQGAMLSSALAVIENVSRCCREMARSVDNTNMVTDRLYQANHALDSAQSHIQNAQEHVRAVVEQTEPAKASEFPTPVEVVAGGRE